MKTIHSLFILFVFGLSAIAPTLQAQEKIFYDDEWNETSEALASYYRLIEEKNSVFHISDYYISGELQFKGTSFVKEDPLQLDGTAYWYHKNGQIAQKVTHENNVPVDSAISYYSSGVVKMFSYFRKGKNHGGFREYYPDGSLAGKADYDEGILNGEFVKYRNPGAIEFALNYENGVLNGAYAFYNGQGELMNKGNVKDGIKDGLCYDYYYEGELKKKYTIKDGKIDGEYIEYASDGSTLSIGEFDMGKVLHFQSTSGGLRNGSVFRKEMNLVDGIEYWKTYRDDVLIIESFYKDGLYTSIWNVFTVSGDEKFQILDFSENHGCGEEDIQPIDHDEFGRFLSLSDRFGFRNLLIDEDNCGSVKVTDYDHPWSRDPIYSVVMTEDLEEEQPVLEKIEDSNIIDYIDPSSTEEFKTRNDCSVHKSYAEVDVCIRSINGIKYVVYLSEDISKLEILRSEATPKDLEIHYFFQRMENRVYDLNEEEPADRYMSFALSAPTMEAFMDKRLDYISVVGALEKHIWTISSFSGMAAYDAFEKELERHH